MEDNREMLVSVVGGRAIRYVTLKKPSHLIPFKGDFPLVEPYQEEDYLKAIQDTHLLTDLSDEFQLITMKGSRIALLEQGFIKYLNDSGISVEDFLKLSNLKKSDYLVKWMDEDCIDYSQLTIK